MVKYFREILDFVKNKLGENLVLELKKFISSINPRLWGIVKPRDFLFKNFILTVFRDLIGVGYQRILDEYELGFHMSHKSFQHNAQQIRLLLKRWGRLNIKLFSKSEWNSTARYCSIFSTFPDGQYMD